MNFYQTKNVGSSITADTLQKINADLDAERMESHQNRTRTCNFNKKPQKPFNVISLQKIDPENTEHMRFCKQFMHFYATLGQIFGMEISYDWKPDRYIRIWLCKSILWGSVSLIMYTIYHHYYYGDYMRILEPIAFAGITISCTQKFYDHLSNFPKMYSLFFTPRKLCLENVTGKRADVLTCGLRKASTILKVYVVSVVALLVGYVAVPAKFYIFDNILIPIIPFEFPFEQTTISRIILALSIQGIMGFCGFVGTLMYGSLFLICICNYKILVDLIGEDFTDLDEMWNCSSTTSVPFRHAYLRNIFQKLQDMNRYLDTTKEIYEQTFFIYFIVNFLGQIICLFEINVSNWIPGYTVVCMLFTEMMFYCIIGTQLSIAGDKLCYSVSCTNWYTYDLTSQRLLVIMLQDCQQPKHLTLGHLGPLDVITLIQVVKGIYTYYTVMLEVM